MKRALIYTIAIIVAILCLVFVIATFKTEIIEAAKWLSIMVVIFCAGWVVGRFAPTKK